MSGILFISDSRESLPIAWRIAKEGVKVDYYIHDRTYGHNFDGIMPKISMGELKRSLRRNDTVIFDITLPLHPPIKPHDLQFLQLFGINPKGLKGLFGAVADKLMDDHKVIGSSSWTEHIELDREAGFKLAKKIGFSIPDYQKFRGLREGIRFLQSEEGKKERWVFKLLNNGPLDLTYPETFDRELLDLMQTSIPLRLQKEKFPPEKAEYILQKFVDGVECSNEVWWNGNNFSCFTRTIESKKLGSNETGPATGSQNNSVAMCNHDIDGPAFKQLQTLEPYLKRSGYIGPLDANVIYGEENSHNPWWLEATFRMGWSALYCLCSFIPKGQLSSFFLNGFDAVFKEGYVASQLLSLYPYPDLNRQRLEMNLKGNLINHKLNDDDVYYQDIEMTEDKKLRCCASDGIIAVITALEPTPEKAINKVLKKCQDFEMSGNRQFRDDHLVKHTKRINTLNKFGVCF